MKIVGSNDMFVSRLSRLRETGFFSSHRSPFGKCNPHLVKCVRARIRIAVHKHFASLRCEECRKFRDGCVNFADDSRPVNILKCTKVKFYTYPRYLQYFKVIRVNSHELSSPRWHWFLRDVDSNQSRRSHTEGNLSCCNTKWGPDGKPVTRHTISLLSRLKTSVWTFDRVETFFFRITEVNQTETFYENPFASSFYLYNFQTTENRLHEPRILFWIREESFPLMDPRYRWGNIVYCPHAQRHGLDCSFYL